MNYGNIRLRMTLKQMSGVCLYVPLMPSFFFFFFFFFFKTNSRQLWASQPEKITGFRLLTRTHNHIFWHSSIQRGRHTQLCIITSLKWIIQICSNFYWWVCKIAFCSPNPHCCFNDEIMNLLHTVNHSGFHLHVFAVYTMWMNKLTISLLNNSEKLVQILLEFSQQIVEGYEFALAKFHWNRPFQTTKLCDLSQNKGWTVWPHFTFVYKMR